MLRARRHGAGRGHAGAGTEEERAGIVAPGRVRVVDREVADRLARLAEAAVTHARAAGRPVRLDLDRLTERVGADVAARRRTS